jgi:hypothetical protein
MAILIFLLQPMMLCNKMYFTGNRLYKRLCNLLFFVCILGIGCKETTTHTGIWVEPGNTALHIPLSRLPDKRPGPIANMLSIRLHGSTTDILGNYKISDDIIFTPAIPFTTGNRYEYWFGDKLIDSFNIPAGKDLQAVSVDIYPNIQKVPVNLLKVYLRFSAPMREGVSDQYLKLVKGAGDTLHDVFLNLQPELWNPDRTVLTVWLDPGRIKRDLQPNQRMGAPLEETSSYTLVIKQGWKTAQGMALDKDVSRSWTTTGRDSLPPSLASWQLQVPKKGTQDALVIGLNESLDHYLLPESIHIQEMDGRPVKGQFAIEANDSRCSFRPDAPWAGGEYQLVVDSRLEDLAGNNLNRPFDRDIIKTKERAAQPYYTRRFSIAR